eukprot:CAMPEP_0194503642 /NCGR_PEP_ID=MMETSP0253-20130528/28494_1 /TAXON_ID=2966 /ORGANISM="Noctiluca scintillans" /LENGTH=52 /DNA_ID=CAMNT_0039345941 /DNA_START=288 /DNA_END=446 /DNA_ORIENTATION=-
MKASQGCHVMLRGEWLVLVCFSSLALLWCSASAATRQEEPDRGAGQLLHRMR